jgi:phospholipid/cholesterol/gamma-HCH transport system substrate-binding protein
METRAGYLLVGTFVLLSIVGIFTFFLWLAKKDVEYNVNFYTIYFPGSVAGLTVGGSVHFLGVPVGTVKDIELDPKNLEVVTVTVAIKNEVPIKEDAYASLELQGLTGYKFVQIYGGSKESQLLKAKPGQKYPVIPSRYSGVEEILTMLPRMVNKFTNLVDRVNATFNEQNRNHFAESLKNIDILSGRLAESSKPLKGLIENASKASETLDREFHDLSHATQKTLTKVDGVTDDIGNYLKKNEIALDTLTQSGSHELIQTLKDTRDMLTTANQFFKKLDENPRSLIFDTQRRGISLQQ